MVNVQWQQPDGPYPLTLLTGVAIDLFDQQGANAQKHKYSIACIHREQRIDHEKSAPYDGRDHPTTVS